MSTAVFEELRNVLQQDPHSLRSEQLLDELLWDAFDMATGSRKRNELIEHETTAGTLSREVLSQADQTAGTWRVWYAGQLQAVAGLLRAVLARQLSFEAEAMLHSRKNMKRILETLLNGGRNLSDLAKSTDLDESQLGRDLKLLERHDLVETVKHGRERWARITATGETALEKVNREMPPSPKMIVKRTWQIASVALGEPSIGIPPEQMERLASAGTMFEESAA